MSERFVAVKPEGSNGFWDVIDTEKSVYSPAICTCFGSDEGDHAKLIVAALNAYENKDTI